MKLYNMVNDADFFALGPDRAPEQVVYCEAAQIEYEMSEEQETGKVAVSVQLDGRAFYEHFAIDLMGNRFVGTGGDQVVAKMVRNIWKGPRLVRIGRTYCPKIVFSNSGLPAGSKFNRSLVMAYCKEPYTRFAERHPNVNFQAFVDDTYIGFFATKSHIVRTVTDAVNDYGRVLKEEMGIDIA